jgi:Mg2+ and Co2+ transporter CorA
VKAGKKISFTRLHNLLKHTIFLRENCDAAINTLENLLAYHQTVRGRNPTFHDLSTRDRLKYRKTIFQSTQGRLLALDQRMANMLQLSFHLVTQRDSRIMQSEALSMKMIAVVTLVFVPLGTVAAVFGAQLIKLEDEAPFRMHVSQDFWLLWVIAIPLTILVVLIWRVWYRNERAQLRDETPGDGDPAVERGYMGWERIAVQMFKRVQGAKAKLGNKLQ